MNVIRLARERDILLEALIRLIDACAPPVEALAAVHQDGRWIAKSTVEGLNAAREELRAAAVLAKELASPEGAMSGDLWQVIQAQRAANNKLQRKYDTVKGDLRTANERAKAAEQAALALRQERDSLREIVETSLPALGCHARDFSQRALIEACKVTGSDPRDWTHHPDVLDRLQLRAAE